MTGVQTCALPIFLAGVILIFLELINMTAALGIMLEKLLTSNDKVKTSSPAFYAGVVALVAFFAALSYIRSLYRPGTAKPSLGRSLGQSLLLGVCAGVLIAALNAVLGRLNADGVKIRAYLDMMSPEAIRTLIRITKGSVPHQRGTTITPLSLQTSPTLFVPELVG